MVGLGHEEDYSGDTYESDFYQAQVEYTLGDLTLAGLVSSKDNTVGSAEAKAIGTQINAIYKINSSLTVHGGYEMIDHDVTGKDDYTGMAVGAIYTFSPLVKLYVELGSEDGAYLNGVKTSTSSKDGLEEVAVLLSLDF
jgi:predicted porin